MGEKRVNSLTFVTLAESFSEARNLVGILLGIKWKEKIASRLKCVKSVQEVPPLKVIVFCVFCVGVFLMGMMRYEIEPLSTWEF